MAMAVVVGIGVAAIVMVALGYVSAYASAEARVHAEHKMLLRSHERIIQHFDPRHYGRGQVPRFPRPQYALEFQPELDDDTPIVVLFRGSRPFRSPTGQIMWTYSESPQGLSLRNHEGFDLLPPGVSPVWSTPRDVRTAIGNNPRWGLVPMERVSRTPYRVRRIG